MFKIKDVVDVLMINLTKDAFIRLDGIGTINVKISVVCRGRTIEHNEAVLMEKIPLTVRYSIQTFCDANHDE